MEALLGGKLWRDGRRRTTNPRNRQEMSGIHEEVFRESTAGRRVEALVGGKLWRDCRRRTTKLQGLREMSGIHETSLCIDYRQQDG